MWMVKNFFEKNHVIKFRQKCKTLEDPPTSEIKLLIE